MAKSNIKEWLEPEKLALIEGWARDGLTDEQIAHNIGISRATLYNWKKKQLDIFNALKEGKQVTDYEVENGLYKRAVGCTVKEVTETTNAAGETTTKVVIKELPPDTTACIYWLKNRQPDKWRDKKQTELSDLEQTARIEKLKAEVENIRSNDNITTEDKVEKLFHAIDCELNNNPFTGLTNEELIELANPSIDPRNTNEELIGMANPSLNPANHLKA